MREERLTHISIYLFISLFIYASIYLRICVSMCIYLSVCVCMYFCAHVFMYVCMCERACGCVRTCACVSIAFRLRQSKHITLSALQNHQRHTNKTRFFVHLKYNRNSTAVAHSSTLLRYANCYNFLDVHLIYVHCHACVLKEKEREKVVCL